MFADLILPTATARNIVPQIGTAAFRVVPSYVVKLHMNVMSFSFAFWSDNRPSASKAQVKQADDR
jgi:hypothetical protein